MSGERTARTSEGITFVRRRPAGQPTSRPATGFWDDLRRARQTLPTTDPRRMMLERIADGDLPATDYRPLR